MRFVFNDEAKDGTCNNHYNANTKEEESSECSITLKALPKSLSCIIIPYESKLTKRENGLLPPNEKAPQLILNY